MKGPEFRMTFSSTGERGGHRKQRTVVDNQKHKQTNYGPYYSQLFNPRIRLRFLLALTRLLHLLMSSF